MILIGILLYCQNNTKKERLKQRDNLRNTSFIIDQTHKIRYKEVPELYIDYLKKNKDFKDSEIKLKDSISLFQGTKMPEFIKEMDFEISKLGEQIDKIKIEFKNLQDSKINNSNDDKKMFEEINSSEENLKEKRLRLKKLKNEYKKIIDEQKIIQEEKQKLTEIKSFLEKLDLKQLSTNYDKKKINCNFNKYTSASKEMKNLNNQYNDFKSKEKIKEEIKKIIKDKLKKRQLLISIQILLQYEEEINKFLSKKHHQEDFINYQLANNEIKFYLDMAIENLIDVKETLIEEIYYKFLKIFLDEKKTTQNKKLPIENIINFVEKIAQANLFKHENVLEKSDDNKNITSYIEDKMVLNISRGKEDNCWFFAQEQLSIKKLDVNDENNRLYTPSPETQKEFTKLFEFLFPKILLSWDEFKQKFLSTENQFNEFSKEFITDSCPNTLFRFLSIGCDKLPYEDVNQFLNQVFDIGWQSR